MIREQSHFTPRWSNPIMLSSFIAKLKCHREIVILDTLVVQKRISQTKPIFAKMLPTWFIASSPRRNALLTMSSPWQFFKQGVPQEGAPTDKGAGFSPQVEVAGQERLEKGTNQHECEASYSSQCTWKLSYCQCSEVSSNPQQYEEGSAH